MMKNLIMFVTTNNAKFEEIQRWLHELDPSLSLVQAALDIPERQSLDAQIIAQEKARMAYQQLRVPLLVDDGGLYLERFHQFPGPLSKYVYQGIGLDGLWELAKPDPRAYFSTVLAYYDGQREFCAHGTNHGRLIDPQSPLVVAQGHAQMPFTKIFIPDGYQKTMAELRGTEEEKIIHHRMHALRKFVTWYHQNKT